MHETPARSARPGLTLVELIVSMVVVGLIGLAMMGLFMEQSSFVRQQSDLREARSVARSAVNIITAEGRMIEAAAGVDSASPQQVTLRLPYAFGLICTASPMVVALLPVDSALYSEAGLSGYAWRDDSGTYTYVEGTAANPVMVADAMPSICTLAGIDTVPGGSVVSLSPEPGGSAGVATPVFLYQNVQYRFTDGDGDGGYDLWRNELWNDGRSEEMSGPFDSAQTKFRFFVQDADTAQDAAPADLSTLAGLQLVLQGISEGSGEAALSAQYTTAVFFKNR